jgi:1-acyl-sn-glycerol-3-phosphate acyltransferase
MALMGSWTPREVLSGQDGPVVTTDGEPPTGHAQTGEIERADSASVIYWLVMAAVFPVVRWWGRLDVVGAQVVPGSGPTLLFVNHDSAWDPLVVGIAAWKRRQVRALARSSLWRVWPMAWVLDHMEQIPLERGVGDERALLTAIQRLGAGACIGVFPEGTVSRGRRLRARSGAGRLALAVPEAPVICTAVTGAVDIARFPRRPKIRVEFFPPAAGRHLPGESAAALAARTMAEIRTVAPVPCQRS